MAVWVGGLVEIWGVCKSVHCMWSSMFVMVHVLWNRLVTNCM